MKLVQVMIFLLFTLLSLNCSVGWSVGGWEITPTDTNTVFIEIMDKDSILHYYHHRLYPTQNWCWIHNQYEDVVRVEN